MKYINTNKILGKDLLDNTNTIDQDKITSEEIECVNLLKDIEFGYHWDESYLGSGADKGIYAKLLTGVCDIFGLEHYMRSAGYTHQELIFNYTSKKGMSLIMIDVDYIIECLELDHDCAIAMVNNILYYLKNMDVFQSRLADFKADTQTEV